MKYLKVFLLMLSIGSCAQAQKKVFEYETVKLTILKIEWVREDVVEVGAAEWLIIKLTMRDSQGIIYKAHLRCMVFSKTVLDSPVFCSHITMPRIAGTYDAKLTYGGTLIYFGEMVGPGFEIDSEEVPPRG